MALSIPLFLPYLLVHLPTHPSRVSPLSGWWKTATVWASHGPCTLLMVRPQAAPGPQAHSAPPTQDLPPGSADSSTVLLMVCRTKLASRFREELLAVGSYPAAPSPHQLCHQVHVFAIIHLPETSLSGPPLDAQAWAPWSPARQAREARPGASLCSASGSHHLGRAFTWAPGQDAGSVLRARMPPENASVTQGGYLAQPD